MNKDIIKRDILNLRMKETHRQIGFFLFDSRVPAKGRQVFARSACLSLLYRIIGEQNYGPNFKTVWFVIKHYFGSRWDRYEMALWFWSHKKLYRRTDEEMERLVCGDEYEEEWPDEVSI